MLSLNFVTNKSLWQCTLVVTLTCCVGPTFYSQLPMKPYKYNVYISTAIQVKFTLWITQLYKLR